MTRTLSWAVRPAPALAAQTLLAPVRGCGSARLLSPPSPAPLVVSACRSRAWAQRRSDRRPRHHPQKRLTDYWPSCHLRRGLFGCSCLQEMDDFGHEGFCIRGCCCQVANLAGVEAGEGPAKGEHRTIGLSLVDLGIEDMNPCLSEFGLDGCQRARPDRGTGLGEQDGHRDFEAQCFLLVLDQTHRLGGLGGVELRSLGWNNDQVGAAHRKADHQRGRAFQVDNHKRGFAGCLLDRADDLSSDTSFSTVKVSGLPGCLAHFDRGRLGSASITVTVASRSASSVARSTADVDFPAPPFELAKTIVGISRSSLVSDCTITFVNSSQASSQLDSITFTVSERLSVRACQE